MSAFVSLSHSDRVELLTDGAVYTPDGVLVDVRRKVWASSFIPLAVTGRGSASHVKLWGAAILALSACGSFDRTMVCLGALIASRAIRDGARDLEFLVVGISEESGPQQAYFHCGKAAGSDIPAYTLWNGGKHMAAIVAPEGFALTPDDIEVPAGDVSLRAIGVPLFERFRRERGQNGPDAPIIHGIGGHVDLTTVTADGANIERLHTWSDVIGETIQPHRPATAVAA